VGRWEGTLVVASLFLEVTMEWRALVRDCQMACEGAVAEANERAETLLAPFVAAINGKLPRPNAIDAVDVLLIFLSLLLVLASHLLIWCASGDQK
jgi:hypothetical protein